MARTPIWREIETTITREIGDGRYRPGDRLPTEAALSLRFGVNRHTVRRALAEMRETGLVHARRGAGVFVAATPMTYPLGRRVRFHAALEAAGRTPEKVTLRLETGPADAREAAALALAEGDPVHVWEGVSFADGVPVCHSISAFPAARLPGLPARLRATGSVTATLAGEGVEDYVRAETDLTAERASATQATHLRLCEGAPLLLAVGVNVDAAGRPVEYGRSWFAGERVRLSVKPG